MRTRPLVALLLLLGLAHPASADDRDEARRAFTLGQAADKRRDYAAAIEHYLRANELAPHPFALYNIAVDYERLGRLRDAATYFDHYLDAAPDANDRDRVNTRILELRARPAKVIIRSFPDGASVKIQGLPQGSTPLTTTLKGGIHRVVVEKDGAKDARDITVEYGEPVEVDVQLRTTHHTRAPTATANPRGLAPGTSAPGGPPGQGAPGASQLTKLRVFGHPIGALVVVDQAPVGQLPLELEIAPGTHVVTVTAAGYSPQTTRILALAGTEVNVQAPLHRALGTHEVATKLHYVVGVAAGVMADEPAGTIILGELGIRAFQYDLSARLGTALGSTAFDIVARYAFLPGRFTPFAGGGYSYIAGGDGWEAVGGVRFDVAQTARFGMTLIAEAQLRWYSAPNIDVAPVGAGTLWPIMASRQRLSR